MWLPVLAILNALLSLFGSKVVRFSAFDISPVAIAIIAWNDGNILFASLILVLAHTIPSPREFRFIWIMLPVTILVGFLATVIPYVFPLLVVYHGIGLLSAWFFQYASGKYYVYVLANITANLVIARIYGLLF